MEKKGRRVLVIDDNEDMLGMIKELLEARGMVCVTAVTAIEGLEKARKNHPNLILLDLMLPKMSGFGVLRELKADPRLSDIPVVVLSAVSDEEVAQEVLDIGASKYLYKTCGTRELISTVTSYFT